MTGKEALNDYKDFGKIKGESITSNKTFTSNEALRILSECANGEKKLLFSDSLDLEQIISKRLEKLEKLERAFEILKDKLNLRVIPCSIFEDETKKYLDYDGDYRKPMTILDNEEAELLEELFKNEEDK